MKKLLSLISIAGLTISGVTATSSLISCSKSTSDNSGNKDDGDRTVDFELREGYVVDFWLEKEASGPYCDNPQEGVHAFLTVGSDNKINSSNDKLKDDLKGVEIPDKTQLTAAKLKILKYLKTTVNELETDLTVTIDSIIKVKDLGVLNSENFENKASEDDIINAINEKNNLNIKKGDFNIEFPEVSDKDTCKATISVDKPNTVKVTEFNVKVFSGSADLIYKVKSFDETSLSIQTPGTNKFVRLKKDEEININSTDTNLFKVEIKDFVVDFSKSGNATGYIIDENGKKDPVRNVSDHSQFTISIVNTSPQSTEFTLNLEIQNYTRLKINGICNS